MSACSPSSGEIGRESGMGRSWDRQARGSDPYLVLQRQCTWLDCQKPATAALQKTARHQVTPAAESGAEEGLSLMDLDTAVGGCSGTTLFGGIHLQSPDKSPPQAPQREHWDKQSPLSRALKPGVRGRSNSISDRNSQPYLLWGVMLRDQPLQFRGSWELHALKLLQQAHGHCLC